MVSIGLIVTGLAALLVFGAFGVSSLREGERRAAVVALGSAIIAALPVFLSVLLPTQVQLAVLGCVAAGIAAGVVFFFLPIGKVERGPDVPQSRVDERDIMFARARLEPGSPNYDAYYTLRPENKGSDDKTRSLPGLLSTDASEANPLIFAATKASFGVTEALREAVDGPVALERTELDAAAMSGYVKGLAHYWGAKAVGIAELKPYHVYSHIGRGSGEYGALVTLKHQYAVAFTVEMDHTMMGAAPASPVTLESARQYVEGARIAIKLGNLFRSLGYPARAHIDANYRVIAPLVARDAGLGEIGRMGLLMTPNLGPRVRLGVVTTDLPLEIDERGDDRSVIDFCRVCKKCADVCPVRAIPFGDREMIDGALRWRINADICFRYWNVIGTDCGRCMALCPYSHPDNALHNTVRWALRRSGAARRTALSLDRVFYGAKPLPREVPSWVPPKSSEIDPQLQR